MSRRIYFDGLNLSLEHGTGIATYTRVLANLAGELGYEVGAVYASPHRPPKNDLMREIAFFDPRNAAHITRQRGFYNWLEDQANYIREVRQTLVSLTGRVIADQFRARMPKLDQFFVARNVFSNALDYYQWTGRFAKIAFDTPPNIMHCTYQLPLRAKGACNLYTIHDLVPLRLPFATLDNKRRAYKLLRQVAEQADHIVTVSENSKRDIVELLGVPEERVTNTYQAVKFPNVLLQRSDELIAAQLRRIYRLEPRNYLFFYGALEPKKNVARLIDAYLLSAVKMPLVIAGAKGWNNHIELSKIEQLRTEDRAQRYRDRRVYHLEYVSLSMLVTLIRGARAVVFPSLYEGFGLPVLEAMALGTPVVTSRTSSLPEVAGDAALYVNPYYVNEIADGIRTVAYDDDLCAELVTRGRAQAERFSLDRYRERIGALYERLS